MVLKLFTVRPDAVVNVFTVGVSLLAKPIFNTELVPPTKAPATDPVPFTLIVPVDTKEVGAVNLAIAVFCTFIMPLCVNATPGIKFMNTFIAEADKLFVKLALVVKLEFTLTTY